jgi:hypothetical protein
MTNDRISIGNAEDFTHTPTRGWFIGNFLDPTTAGPRSTDNIEVKWSIHPVGDHRPDIAPGADTVTLTILISGAFEQIFPDQQPDSMLMERPGDFALYGPDVPHTWRALADSVMLTVRWKSHTPAGARPESD